MRQLEISITPIHWHALPLKMTSWQTAGSFHTGLQTMNHSPRGVVTFIIALCALAGVLEPLQVSAAGGVLTLATRDEATDQAVPARLELRNAAGRKTNVRRAVANGPGVVLDRSLDLALPSGQYRFRLVRGPEYQVWSGEFTLEPTAADERLVTLPRMVDMRAEGYLSGDMAVADASPTLPLRMAAEDLHVAAVIAQPNPPDWATATDKLTAEQSLLGPLWINQSVVQREGVLIYPAANDAPPLPSAHLASATLAQLAAETPARVAIADPFAWQLPVWLASGRVDGLFILGDWLREGTRVEKLAGSRPVNEIGFGGPQGPGRYAESVYWRLLEAGFTLAPLAGTGPAASTSAVGYNRVYAIGPAKDPEDQRQVESVSSEQQWYEAVWAGRSVVTNGPLLRPTLGGQAPGHCFEARQGEVLQMAVELHLAVRDPVDYLEVIHNGEVFYSARLDEFSLAGGMIPPLTIDRSGWVLVRVVTGYDDHFRAAISAPWYIHFDGAPRISRKAVEFFGRWLVDCETHLKKLPPAQLAAHIAPVQTARAFWNQRLQAANAD